jgi:hypothetical protein
VVDHSRLLEVLAELLLLGLGRLDSCASTW